MGIKYYFKTKLRSDFVKYQKQKLIPGLVVVVGFVVVVVVVVVDLVVLVVDSVVFCARTNPTSKRSFISKISLCVFLLQFKSVEMAVSVLHLS